MSPRFSNLHVVPVALRRIGVESKFHAISSLLERHPATVIRRLLNGIDQAVQVDRGLEGRLAAFAVADRLSEQRVH